MVKRIQTISPVDGSIYVERSLPTESEIQTTMEKANKAFNIWRSKSITERAEICSKAVDLFVLRREKLAEEITWQMGRPIQYSGGEIDSFAERARYMIKVADTALIPIQLPEKIGFERFIKREPLGLVFVIAPWNYPYLTAVNTVLPALMAGNSVILKHSAQTPLCAERFVEIFNEAGMPEGVFQFLHLDHDNVAKLVKSPTINYIAFTGSVAGGGAIEKTAAGRFIGIGLELGGKDPAYVRHDADLENAIAATVDGAFFNSGQSCCGIERIYVHESVYEDYIDGVIAAVGNYQLGTPDNSETTLGPMVTASSAKDVRKVIQEATDMGAKAHIDFAQFPMNEEGTPYLAPQVLTNVDHQMRVMSKETFGPVVGIMSVKNDEQAIELMNDSQYGLTASIFTKDNDVAISLGEKINTGTFFQNRCDYLDPELAWTGVKNSGRGCTLSTIGYESLTRPKSFHLKHL